MAGGMGPSASAIAAAMQALGAGSPISVQIANDFENLVADGLIDGTSIALKFGSALVDTTERSLRGYASATTYTYPSSGFQVEAISTDADDNASGAGARTLRIAGIRADTFAEDSEDIDLNGLTAAQAASPITWWRITGAYVTGSGVYGQLDNAAQGVITVRTASAGQAHLTMNGQGQTLVADYSVPAGKAAHVHGLILCSESTKPATVHMHVRERYDVVSAPFPPARLRQLFPGFTGIESIPFDHPLVLDEKSDLMYGAKLSSGTGIVSVLTVIELRDKPA